MIQLSAFQRWLLRHYCPLHTGSLPCSLPCSWALLSGICLSSGRTVWGFKEPRNHHIILPSPSACWEIWARSAFYSIWLCFLLSASPSCTFMAHLQMLWRADLSNVLVCMLDVICWDVGVQLLVVSRREKKGDPLHCHVSDIISTLADF